MKSNKNENDIYFCGKRSVAIFAAIMCGFVLCWYNMVMINIDSSILANDMKSSKSLVLGESRGIIYDCNLNKLVSQEYSYICAAKPDVKSAEALREVMDAEEYVNAIDEISKGNPIKFSSADFIENNNIVCAKLYKRYNDKQVASHLIGYVDSDNNGVCGIEKIFDPLLRSYSGSCTVRYFTDGTGRIMQGSSVEKRADGYNSNGGIVLTIDKNIQMSVEEAMDSGSLDKGAAVVIDIKSGAVRAMVSRPDYNPSDIEKSIDDKDSPLFNRAVAAYPVGSVFKPLVAVSALEQGKDPSEVYECKGYITDGNSTFTCPNKHGEVNMASALMCSCNCYFINLMNGIDVSQLLQTASSSGFGYEYELCNGFYAHSGNLPTNTELDSFASRANLSFGQGSLSANVFQIASLYAAIANGGAFNLPYIVEGECDEKGNLTLTYKQNSPRNAFGKKSSEIVSSCLELTVREGTGSNAKCENFAVAGKTATAQTGDFSKEKERLVTWFAGFFPYENPEYVMVIVCEDGESGSTDCAPIFSKVASKFYF